MDSSICYCISCASFGGKLRVKKTILEHATQMFKDGYKPESYPWLQQFCNIQRQPLKVQPLTALGQLIHNEEDSRRRPVHDHTDLTQITFMALILKLKNKYTISKEDTNELLLMFQKIAPSKNLIPQNIQEIHRLTKDLLVEHEEHVICVCEAYRFGDKDKCERCNTDKAQGTKYYTIPIGPRLQQLREVSALAKLTSLMANTEKKHRFVSDLHQSSSWSSFSREMGHNAIALSYCSDGFNPFHHIISQGTYSIWAQSSLILNLPPQLRSKVGTTMLLGLISGPRAPKKLNVYNELVVNELVQLKTDGLTTYNAFSKQLEIVKVGLLYMVGDVPGMAKEQNRVQQNAKTSCGHCTVQGIHSKVLDKTVYPGGRKFLEADHPLRLDKSFPKGDTESGSVIMRTMEQELTDARYLDMLQREQRDEGKKTDTLASAMAQHSGRYGSNHWFRLNLDLQQQHAPVEPMHAMKIIAEHVVKLINGDEDGAKVRAEERLNGRGADYCPDAVFRIYYKEKKTIGEKRRRVEDADQNDALETKFPKNQLPQAPYVLTQAEKKEADRRLGLVNVPIGFGVIPNSLFTKIVGGTKCHTWLQLLTSGMLRFCLRGMLGEPQRAALMNLLLLLEEAYGSVIDMENFDRFEKRWHEGLCLMEKEFPVSLQTFYFHLLHHLPQYLKLYGPPNNFWMYPYERFNHTLTESVSSNQHPELSAIKKIEVQWLLTMLDSSGFFLPLRPNVDKTPEGLYAGRCKVVERRANREEVQALLGLGVSDDDDDLLVKIYHHARTSKGLYRSSHIEKDDQREKASMVVTNGFVGTIAYFIKHMTRELALVKWIGLMEMDVETKCYFAKSSSTDQLPASLVDIEHLSSPRVYALEEGIVWVPTLT